MKYRMALLVAAAVWIGAVRVSAQDGQIVYDDTLANGWVSYGWATLNFANTSPVHGGAKSISVTDPTSSYQALYLHHAAFNSSLFQSLTFWINGGATGGQLLRVQGLLNGNVTATNMTLAALPANTWQQVTINLSDLGVANQSNFDGFWIQNVSGAPAPTFYIDDIALNAAPAPQQIQLTINAGSAIRTIDERLYGMNLAVWDSLLSGADNNGLMNAMGTRLVRFPGGSLGDDYDWQTNRSISNGGSFQWVNSAATFASVASARGTQAYITVNYGSGTPEQAAAWVAYYNGDPANTTALGTDSKARDWKTVGYWAGLRAATPLGTDDGFNFLRVAHPAPYGFLYWEVGNECYGSWEYDQHGAAGSGLTGLPHNAATYATGFKLFYAKMLAVDPTIKIGAVFDPAFVTSLGAAGAAPHFVIYHRYPQQTGSEDDATLLQAAGGVATDAATVRQAVNTAFGASGASIELAMTELNSTVAGVGKQSVSLVNGLFMADSLAFTARTEFNACIWWNLRNAGETTGNLSASLYGWRPYGDYGVLASGDRSDTPANTPYPTYYASKLLTHWGRGCDQVVTAASNYPLLSVHAARLVNGQLALLVVNRSSSTDATAQLAIAGFAPDANATVYQYGKPNDLANGDLTTTTFNGASAAFSYTFPSYSMTVIVLSGQGAPPGTGPSMNSAPTASPNPATTGAPVMLSASASGSNLTYAWTFGDGGSGSGALASHLYTSAGTYTAIVTVTDGNGATANGSVDVVVTDGSPLSMSKLFVKLNFARSNQDSITVTGTLPLTSGFIVAKQNVTINVGGIVRQFTLISNGGTARGNDAFKLCFKTKSGTVAAQNAPFSATFTRGYFAAALKGFGLTNATVSNVSVMIPVSVLFNQKSYSTISTLHYSAKSGRTGAAN